MPRARKDKVVPDLTEALRNYKAIEADYAYNGDVMCEDSEVVRRYKYILDNCLDIADKKIFVLYTDRGSFREVAEKLGCSHETLRQEVKRIRQRMKDEYERLFGTDATDCDSGLRN